MCCPRDPSIPTRAVPFPPGAFRALLVAARTGVSLPPPPGGFARRRAAPDASAFLTDRPAQAPAALSRPLAIALALPAGRLGLGAPLAQRGGRVTCRARLAQRSLSGRCHSARVPHDHQGDREQQHGGRPESDEDGFFRVARRSRRAGRGRCLGLCLRLLCRFAQFVEGPAFASCGQRRRCCEPGARERQQRTRGEASRVAWPTIRLAAGHAASIAPAKRPVRSPVSARERRRLPARAAGSQTVE